MDYHSTLDHNSSPAGAEARVLEGDPGRLAVGKVSATLAATPPRVSESTFRFPGDDSGHTLAQIAQRDLDAALQLLAERAQYITGATGAAIALRRGLHNDMLCRASAGSSAPGLGALLSAESGLSGESVRARLPLRCDDAERDPRVNRNGCRELGIASVAVMPILSDDQVLGVFELFSGKVNAFGERDLSALQRLGEMVETAVKLVHPAPKLPPEVLGPEAVEDGEPVVEMEAVAPAPVRKTETITASLPGAEPPQVPAAQDPAAAKRPLFWSAAASATGTSIRPQPDESHVPPVLRNLHKCHACGFPVSEGRLLCVECEDKRWRGQLRPPAARQSAMAASTAVLAPSIVPGSKGAEVSAPAPPTTTVTARAAAPAQARATETPIRPTPMPTSASPPEPANAAKPSAAPFAASTKPNRAGESAQTPAPLPFLSAGIAPAESWLSANKYILGAIVVVAIIVAAIALLR